MAFKVATATACWFSLVPKRVKGSGRCDSHILWRATREAAVSFECEMLAEATRQHKLRWHPAGHM